MSGHVAALVLGLVCTAVGQVSYKLVFARGRAYLVPALGCFALAQASFFFALTGLGVGDVYLSTGATHALVLGLSHFVLGEPLRRSQVLAVGMIVAGISLYAV